MEAAMHMSWKFLRHALMRPAAETWNRCSGLQKGKPSRIFRDESLPLGRRKWIYGAFLGLFWFGLGSPIVWGFKVKDVVKLKQ